MNADTLEGDHSSVDPNADQDSSDDEYQQKVLSLREKRRKYYEEKRKPNVQHSSMKDILEDRWDKQLNEGEKRFTNIRIHVRIPKSQYSTKDDSEDEIYLKGELEIVDFITFEDLSVKAINLFNSQLTSQGLKIELLKERSKYFTFRYAKRDGVPDNDFPWFDSSQKVSQCGVTNVWLMYEIEWINYIQNNPINNASTNANTFISNTESKSEVSASFSKKSGIKKGDRNIERMDKSNGSWKCIIF